MYIMYSNFINSYDDRGEKPGNSSLHPLKCTCNNETLKYMTWY